MMKSRLNKRGQAALELAILGSLILIGFSVLLSYGQSLDFQQLLKMQAFRRALQYSYQTNAPVSYTLKKDTRSADIFSGFGQGKEGGSTASASVMWIKGQAGLQGESDDEKESISKGYYQINEEVPYKLDSYIKKVRSATGDPAQATIPVQVYNIQSKKVTNYRGGVKRQEDTGKISNIRTSELKDTVTTQLFVRYDQSESDSRKQPWEVQPDYVYHGGNYTDYTGGNHTIINPDPYVQGAYLEKDGDGNWINRVIYSKGNADKSIKREREWETKWDIEE